MICHCKGVTDSAVRELVAAGVNDVERLAALCGAGSDCGSCLEFLSEVVVGVAGRPSEGSVSTRAPALTGPVG